MGRRPPWSHSDVRCRRLEPALTQQELADRAGISRNARVRLEASGTEPRPATLPLANALGTTAADLIRPESATSEPSA